MFGDDDDDEEVRCWAPDEEFRRTDEGNDFGPRWPPRATWQNSFSSKLFVTKSEAYGMNNNFVKVMKFLHKSSFFRKQPWQALT